MATLPRSAPEPPRKRKCRSRSVLVEKPRVPREPLTETQRALAIQFRPMAHKFQRESFGPLAEMIGYDDMQGWVDYFLCEAAQRFNPAKGNEFSTYLYWWIRGRLLTLNTCRNNDGFTFAMRDVDLAKDEDIPGPERRGSIVARAHAPENEADSPDAHDENAMLHRMLRHLPPNWRTVIEERYGMIDGEPKSYRQLAGRFGLSKERIRQLEVQATDRLRKLAGISPAAR